MAVHIPNRAKRIIAVTAIACASFVAAPVRPSFAVDPALTASPDLVTPGATVTVSGVGFAPFERVDVYFDTTDVGFAGSDSAGSFGPVEVTVPAAAGSAVHYLSAEGHHSGLFAQTTIVVTVNWPMAGFSPAGRRANPYETVITTANVARLDTAWTQPTSPFGNGIPFIAYNGVVFTAEITGGIHAFAADDGRLLWKGSTPGDPEFVTPAAVNGRVYFGDSSGKVSAFDAVCATDGSNCPALWRRSMGAAVTTSLVARQGLLYVPTADGTFHVLNPATGATVASVGTSGGPQIGTPITFGADGSHFWGTQSTLNFVLNCCAGTSSYGGIISPVAFSNNRAYFTSADGKLNEFVSIPWTASTSTGGCRPAPAIAMNAVYAAGCSTLGAYRASSGQLRWLASSIGPIIPAVSYANGIVYACVGRNGSFTAADATAFDAATGALLWSGGDCSAQPIVVNGTLYVTGNAELTAYRIDGDSPATVHRPSAAELSSTRR